MRKTILTTVAALSVLCTFAQWKPAGDKLKTPWAEKIDPANVLPEYPRPQLVRSQWMNLNGLWDYAIKPVGALEPKMMDGKILPSPSNRRCRACRKALPKRTNCGIAARSAYPQRGKAAT